MYQPQNQCLVIQSFLKKTKQEKERKKNNSSIDTFHTLRKSYYIRGSQSVVRGPPGVLEGAPGGPQINDGKLVTKWTLRVIDP